ncbi:hypothetical protein M8J76_000205 [Diaphorina citri]|nr:hypothetical protein M8J75_001550 [Diaphorina citri]KAI5718771.1 hypothetical protein M8J76_000205 [Diaphorina citri]KAI5720811.1 hypothetical protein M8J77_011936 [Diaphorina citri]
MEKKKALLKFQKDPNEVETYLKQQIGQFNAHKNKILEKIDELYDMNQETFDLRQQLNRRNEQLFEVKSTISNLQFSLMQQQDQNLSLLKENDELRLRLLDYQKKVQILMAYAKIPDDFPILSLVKSNKSGIVVERKIPRKPVPKTDSQKSSSTTKPNQDTPVCKCTVHSNLDPPYAICSTCGKYIKNTDTTNSSDSESNFISKSQTNACKSRTFSQSYSGKTTLKQFESDVKNGDFINDIDQANLIILSLKSQLHEMKYNYDKHIDLLVQDMKLQQEEHKIHIDNYSSDCDYYNTYVKNVHRVLYRYLYEDMCSTHVETSYLSDLYKYMICVHKCRQLLGDKFPQCIKQYLTPTNTIDPTPPEVMKTQLDSLLKQLQKYKQANLSLNLQLSSEKIKQQENLLAMNARIELYKRKYDELVERKNRDSKVWSKQNDALIRELNELKRISA